MIKAEERRTSLLTGLRRGAAAGALAGGLSLISLAFLWAFSLSWAIRGISSTVLLGLPVGISLTWAFGAIFGAVCGACGGALRAWSGRRLASVAAGALLGFFVYSVSLWIVLLAIALPSPVADLAVMTYIAMALGALGAIPGMCGAFWGQPSQSRPPSGHSRLATVGMRSIL